MPETTSTLPRLPTRIAVHRGPQGLHFYEHDSLWEQAAGILTIPPPLRYLPGPSVIAAPDDSVMFLEEAVDRGVAKFEPRGSIEEVFKVMCLGARNSIWGFIQPQLLFRAPNSIKSAEDGIKWLGEWHLEEDIKSLRLTGPGVQDIPSQNGNWWRVDAEEAHRAVAQAIIDALPQAF
ncbi:MAG: hypothetical protein R3E98_01155 [Gemmatimonadota bacterium]